MFRKLLRPMDEQLYELEPKLPVDEQFDELCRMLKNYYEGEWLEYV